MNRNIRSKLRKELAELYPEVSSIRRILDDVGIAHSQINFQVVGIDIWHAVVLEAEKNDKVEALLAVVEQEYESIGQFRKHYQ